MRFLFVLFLFFAVPALGAKPLSVIKLTVDGGGMGQMQLLMDYVRWKTSKPSHLEKAMNMGAVMTVDTSPYGAMVPDSAQAATQMELGVPAFIGVIGIGAKGETESVRQLALQKGMSIGNISNMQIVHATPAAVMAQEKLRSSKSNIAVDSLTSGVSVVLGGGRAFYLPQSDPESLRSDDRDLIQELKEKKYQVVTSKQEFQKIVPSKDAKVFGLFAVGHMANAFKASSEEPSLTEMLEKTLKILSQNPKGFYLAVEEGQVDYASHYNDPGWVLKQLLLMDKVIGVLLKFQKKNPRTLILITADHETGGFHVGYDKLIKNQHKKKPLMGKDFVSRKKLYPILESQKKRYSKIMKKGMGDVKKFNRLIKKKIHSSFDLMKTPDGKAHLYWLAFAPYIYAKGKNPEGELTFYDEAETFANYGRTGHYRRHSREDFPQVVEKYTGVKLKPWRAKQIYNMDMALFHTSRTYLSNRLYVALRNLGFLNVFFASSSHSNLPVWLVSVGPQNKFSKSHVPQWEIGRKIKGLIKGNKF